MSALAAGLTRLARRGFRGTGREMLRELHAYGSVPATTIPSDGARLLLAIGELRSAGRLPADCFFRSSRRGVISAWSSPQPTKENG